MCVSAFLGLLVISHYWALARAGSLGLPYMPWLISTILIVAPALAPLLVLFICRRSISSWRVAGLVTLVVGAVTSAALANAESYAEWARYHAWQRANIERGEVVSRIDYGQFVEVKVRYSSDPDRISSATVRLYPYREDHLQMTLTGAAGGALLGGLFGLAFWSPAKSLQRRRSACMRST